MAVTPLRRLDPWLPPLLLMGLIFFLSDQPNLSSGLGWIDVVGRKIVHAGEYALLCVLWWRALRQVSPPRTAAVLALLVSVGYAGTDEYHQTFVEGRSGSLLDVGVDALGAGLAALVLSRRPPAREPRAPRPRGRVAAAERRA